MKHITIPSLLLLLGLSAPATDSPSKPQKTAADLALSKTFLPTALTELRPLLGQKILLVGKVTHLSANKNESVRYLNFTEKFHDSVSLVFFIRDGGGYFTKESLSSYVNKNVRIHGVLSEYEGTLQIVIESLDQILIHP